MRAIGSPPCTPTQITFIREEKLCAEPSSLSPCLPYGTADLLLGVDILEASRAIDPREHFRVASPDRTAAVLNLYKKPTISILLGQKDFEPESLRQEIFGHCREELSYAKDLSEIC